ncbi:hypothetical protein K438DRAFT_2000103 [Mycena galopus ATCC 62051]|nr:hypothetical protein K438DRAFT_2000103 [Mycena galopus ATCC 62051]
MAEPLAVVQMHKVKARAMRGELPGQVPPTRTNKAAHARRGFSGLSRREVFGTPIRMSTVRANLPRIHPAAPSPCTETAAGREICTGGCRRGWRILKCKHGRWKWTASSPGETRTSPTHTGIFVLLPFSTSTRAAPSTRTITLDTATQNQSCVDCLWLPLRPQPWRRAESAASSVRPRGNPPYSPHLLRVPSRSPAWIGFSSLRTHPRIRMIAHARVSGHPYPHTNNRIAGILCSSASPSRGHDRAGMVWYMMQA